MHDRYFRWLPRAPVIRLVQVNYPVARRNSPIQNYILTVPAPSELLPGCPMPLNPVMWPLAGKVSSEWARAPWSSVASPSRTRSRPSGRYGTIPGCIVNAALADIIPGAVNSLPDALNAVRAAGRVPGGRGHGQHLPAGDPAEHRRRRVRVRDHGEEQHERPVTVSGFGVTFSAFGDQIEMTSAR